MESAVGWLGTLALGVPLLVGLAGLLAWARRNAALYCRVAGWATAITVLAVTSLGALVVGNGPADLSWGLWANGPIRVGLYIDTLSAIMAALTAGIGMVTCRYSVRYLDGSEGQARFLGWTLITLSAVLGMVFSRSLLTLLLCWGAVSLGLHQLLTYFPGRPAAQRAAWKKFLISRIGDACLLGAVALAWAVFGTLEIPELFRLAAEGESSLSLSAMAVLLALGAMTKSAQIPFHTWLPETMEAPTPLSALMHAGIINSGGFLIVRLSPLVTQSPLAMALLLVVGALTALAGALVMATQSDIKRSLAYSTISQMGFMMMQCGLGAFSAAVLHIVAHGLYKAYAFLGTGAAASWASRGPQWPLRRAALMGALALGVSAGTVSLGLALSGVDLWLKPGGLAIATFLTAGAAVVAFRAFDPGVPWPSRAVVLAAGLPLVLAYLEAWKLMEAALAPLLALSRQPVLSPAFTNGFCLAAAVVTFATLFLGWVGRPLANSALGRKLYVLALNGLYVADLARLPFQLGASGKRLPDRQAA
jgi:NAD(P)H-quinone oxidoreductase subunit 5